ncbi:MAG: exosortase [Candidatus Rokuibacteriota bacterium]
MARVTEIPGAAATSSIWLSLGLPAVVALGLYAPLAPSLIREWAEFPHLSHGFAVPFIAAYLVWCRRNRLREVRAEPSLWGLPALVLGLAALVVGVQGQESFVARISLPITLLGLTLFLAGPAVTRCLWIGIAYLVFMVPLPWTTFRLLASRARLFDASVSAAALDRLGVPVYQDGVFLHLAAVTLEVADACSSIQSASALLALGGAYVSVVQRPTAIRVTLVVMTLPLAVAANIARIVTTALGVHYFGVWTLQSAYHLFSGSVNFVLTLLLLLLLDTAMVRWSRRRA